MFVPIADANPLEHVVRPYATWGLLLANVFVFTVLQHGATGPVSEAGVLGFGAIPAVVTGQAVLPEGYERLPADLTLVTYMFLHGGWLHLLGNMAFLWVFADNVEDAMGHLRFIAFYLLCGVAAAGAHILAQPASEAPLVGASGGGGGGDRRLSHAAPQHPALGAGAHEDPGAGAGGVGHRGVAGAAAVAGGGSGRPGNRLVCTPGRLRRRGRAGDGDAAPGRRAA